MALDDFTPSSEPPENDLDSPSPALPAEGDDLFDFEAEELDAESPLAASEESPAPATPSSPQEACSGLDPELDIDLFGFPPMDLSSLGIEPEEASSLEADLEVATSGIEDLLSEELSELDPVQPSPEPTPPPAAPAAVAAPAPAPATAPAVAPAPVAIAARPTSAASWVLTVAVVVFLFGLLGIAWRATSNVQQQLQQVRSDVDASAERIGQRTAAELREIVAAQGQSGSTLQERGPSGLPSLEPLHETSLLLAEEAIDEARFPEARRILFQLLAEVDRLPEGQREAVEQRAAYMIADSHRAEAESLVEVAR